MMKNILTWIIIILLLSIFWWIITPTFLGFITIIIFGVILVTGLEEIPNRPPQIAIVTLIGKKIWRLDGKTEILKEGLQWIFLKKILFDTLLISKKTRQKSLNPQSILTPDNADIQIPISLGWNVDEEDCSTYINIGEDPGVDTHIQDIIEGRLREYSRHPDEGPMDWKEMIASSLKTLDFLIKSLCGDSEEESEIKNDGYDHLIKIDDNIPTPILLDWYSQKNPTNPLVRKKWGDGEEWSKPMSINFDENWNFLLMAILSHGIDIIVIKEKIDTRIKLLKKLSAGQGKIRIKNTGTYLTRLTVGDVSPDPNGEIYKADIEIQKEERERKSEQYEVETDFTKAKSLIEYAQKFGINIPPDEAYQTIMKYKAIKEGKGFVYEGSLGGLAGIASFLAALMKGGQK
jgi:hypothetical protein